LVAIVAITLSTPVLAAQGNGKNGSTNTGHLYLYEKDPVTWEIVEDPAWGKLKYNLSGSTFDFVFNGKKLEAGSEYALIYYPDPWPGDGLICLGFGTADNGSNVHIKGSVNTGDLPIDDDKNNFDNPNRYPWIDEDYNGAKIWLVQHNDVDCENHHFKQVWNPEEYLFEYDLICFDDTDVD